MSKYIEPVIHVQITVPHIPFGRYLRRHAEGGVAEDQQRDTEQVRILPVGVQGITPSGQRDECMGEVLPLTVQKERFRIFQIKDISAQGRALLLQILRMYPAGRVGGTGQIEQQRLSDALAFTVEFRRSGDAMQVLETEQAHTAATLTPGLNSIVIYLAEDGTPANYSIDGAKS